MQTPSEHIPDSAHSAAPPRRSFWQMLGGTSLTVSLLFHGLLLVIGAIWVFQIIQPSEKIVDFTPRSGGGSLPTSDRKSQQQRVQMAQPNLSRLVALGATGISLPEPDPLTANTSLGKLPSSMRPGGMGGSGTGGGVGTGDGPGVGGGLDPGMTDGSGSKNPFGMVSMERGALEGTLYDMKQTKDGKPTGMTDVKMREELVEITRRGFRDSQFSKYFKAPRQLYQTKFFIPTMSADAAPAAFEVEKEVQPKMWVVVYRGAIQAPRSGKFRFVGQCDDFMVVRFNNRPVFDFGYTMAGTGGHVNGRADDYNGTNDDSALAKEVRRLTPMRLPITFYRYASTPAFNQHLGGLAVGPEFEVEAGRTYPIDIMIGEIPGGSFSLVLLIEEIGATYQKDPAGFPILPLFRLDGSQPDPELKGQAPPYDPDGPVWKFVPGGQRRDI